MFGVQSFGPIINQPNSAIPGVSSTIEKPVVVNGEIVIRPVTSEAAHEKRRETPPNVVTVCIQ